jgi:response regulator RpfG family c-di-GMP phosphodiesterase
MTDVPLKVLVVDPSDSSAEILAQTMKGMSEVVLSAERTRSLSEAQNALADSDINAIYIDPLSLGLDAASGFIFDIRERLPSTVFVLYLDFARMERIRAEFYRGERRRFAHYFKLDKLTPIAIFPDELKATIRQCQNDLSFGLTKERITKLQDELASIQANTSAETVSVPMKVLRDIQEQLESLKARQQERPPGVKPKTVFLSYRFAESEYVDGLRTLLEREGFEITTGQDANTFISQAILERIRLCEFFVCLMTRADEKKDRTFTTSPWLLEEKGAALAMGKRIVLMVEDGVNDIGGLQGDWQRIHFTAKSFTSAAIRAVDQLKSYSG